MEDSVDMIILTKSSKHGKLCVAGIDTTTHEWIRLVSDDDLSHGALPKQDIQYSDGSYCEPLDVVQVQVLKAYPTAYQPENILIDNSFYIEKLGSLSINDIIKLYTPEKNCVILDNDSPYITQYEIGSIGRSLFMVAVNNLEIYYSQHNKRRASFIYNSISFKDISITDPEFKRIGRIAKQAILVMSLPDTPHSNGYYYKLIAKVFTIK